MKNAGNGIARDSLIMVVSGLTIIVFRYFYQLSMGILLTPIEYGTLFSLTSILAIVMIFSQGIQTAIAKFTSVFEARNSEDKVKYLWISSLKRGMFVGLALFIIFIIFTPLLSNFLNIDNKWYLPILLSSSLFIFTLPVNRGILQGRQNFLVLGSTNALLHLLILALAVVLVYLGLGVSGGLIPFVVAYFAVFLITLLALKPLSQIPGKKSEMKGLLSYTGKSLLAVLFFAIVTNIDIILIKHYFSPDDAGIYSAISVLGKICLYAPMGITIAMFPKTSILFEFGSVYYKVLLKAVIYTLLFTVPVLIAYGVTPDSISNFIFGDKYPQAATYVFQYGLAMTLFAISYLLMNYFLSINRTRVIYPLLITMILQLVLIIFFHSSIAQVIQIILISGALSIVFLFPLLRMPGSKVATAG